MTTVGYNHCNVITNNFSTENQYLNVNVSIVKNEPIDSTTNFIQQSNSPNQQIYYTQQQVQNINFSSHLPPTPPSPTGHSLSNSSSDAHFENIQMNINNQISTSNNKINQFNSQISNQPNNQLKNESTYLSIKNHQNSIQPNQHNITNKYRKKLNQSHNAKPYSLPSHDQLTRQEIRTKKSVEKRNERERKRVKNVNLGFEKLRNHIPTKDISKKKMSKAETLRSAVHYIRYLEKMLNNPDDSSDTAEFFLNMLQKNNSELSNSQTIDDSNNQYSNQDNSSSNIDYFDLTELLS